jgi:hypothetical protein
MLGFAQWQIDPCEGFKGTFQTLFLTIHQRVHCRAYRVLKMGNKKPPEGGCK